MDACNIPNNYKKIFLNSKYGYLTKIGSDFLGKIVLNGNQIDPENHELAFGQRFKTT